jgi:PAS domain S-box-containing protein
VLDELTPIQAEIEATEDRSFLQRTAPYCTESNCIDCVVVTFTDVTLMKRAEELLRKLNDSLEEQVTERVAELKLAAEDQARLASLVQSSSAAILGVRLDGTIEYWSPAAETLFGYPTVEAVGEHISRLILPERVGEFERLLSRLQSGQAVQDFETVQVHHDGRRLDVLLTASLVNDDDGEPQAVCLIIHSIHDQKRLEQELTELTDRERQQFARDLHDTVGQQLTSMSMYASALRHTLAESPLDSEPAELQHLESALTGLRHQVRTAYQGLVPVSLDSDGLRVALEGLAEEIQHRHGMPLRDGICVTRGRQLRSHSAIPDCPRSGPQRGQALATESDRNRPDRRRWSAPVSHRRRPRPARRRRVLRRHGPADHALPQQPAGRPPDHRDPTRGRHTHHLHDPVKLKYSANYERRHCNKS